MILLLSSRNNRRLVGLATLVIGAAVGMWSLVRSSGSAADPYTGELSVLARPAGPGDALPDVLRTGQFASSIDPRAQSHFIGIHNGKRYYVVPGLNDQLCLLFVDPPSPAGVNGGACFNRAQVTVGVALATDGNSGGRDAALIVPNGYSTGAPAGPGLTGTEAGPVSNNVQFMTLHGNGSATVTGTGAKLPKLTYGVPLAP